MWWARAAVALAATAALPPDLVRTIRALPVLAMEPPLAAAVGRNLGPLRIGLKAHALRRDGRMEVRLTAPLTVNASGGAALRVRVPVAVGYAASLDRFHARRCCAAVACRR